MIKAPSNKIEAAILDLANWVIYCDKVENTGAGFCIKHCQRYNEVAWDVNRDCLWWHEGHIPHTYAGKCVTKSCKNYNKYL